MGNREVAKVVFTYDVPADDQNEYIRISNGKIRPFWESHGCRSYFHRQGSDNLTAFVKEMVFEELTTMEKSMGLHEAKSVKELFLALRTTSHVRFVSRGFKNLFIKPLNLKEEINGF